MIKRITFDKYSKDYKAELDGELIGYFKDWTAADNELNRLLFERGRRAA